MSLLNAATYPLNKPLLGMKYALGIVLDTMDTAWKRLSREAEKQQVNNCISKYLIQL